MKTSPLKAIREKCLDCSGNNQAEIKRCEIEGCALHPFRMGKNPYRLTRQITDEQRKSMVERLALARKVKNQNQEEQ